MRPSSAASVVAQRRPTAERSSSGGGLSRRREYLCSWVDVVGGISVSPRSGYLFSSPN